MTTYADFLEGKRRRAPSSGIECVPLDTHPSLFEFQRHIVAWAVRRGRAAIWADTGLGKSRCQVEWARILGVKTLILAPLAVTHQTVQEAASIGVVIRYAEDGAAAEAAFSDGVDIVITNYDRLHKFDPTVFDAVVLDESSVLAPFSGIVKRALVDAFRDTRYRLSCSATPAPNDLEELCNQADFLGIMTPQEMRSTFFIADNRGEFMRYRLKGHARTAFYEWLASWAIACRTPSDLGFPDADYILPQLSIHDHLIPTDWTPDGELFATTLKGIVQRSEVRRETVSERVEAAVALVLAEPDERWLVWCGTNDEANMCTARLAEFGAINVQGSDPAATKAVNILAFAAGEIPILVTKPSIAGFGLNLQCCARMVFVGLSDSYQMYYQAIRRCWRFGQSRPVDVHIVLTEVESVIVENVRSKESTARDMKEGLASVVASQNRAELFHGTSRGDCYEPLVPVVVPQWMRSEP